MITENSANHFRDIVGAGFNPPAAAMVVRHN